MSAAGPRIRTTGTRCIWARIDAGDVVLVRDGDYNGQLRVALVNHLENGRPEASVIAALELDRGSDTVGSVSLAVKPAAR